MAAAFAALIASYESRGVVMRPLDNFPAAGPTDLFGLDAVFVLFHRFMAWPRVAEVLCDHQQQEIRGQPMAISSACTSRVGAQQELSRS